jgi:hypothetical protein
VVIVPVNAGMIKLADNLVCSLTKTTFNISSIVFWALDGKAETILGQRGFATYRDVSLFATSEDTNSHGNTAEYTRMMLERPKFFTDLLSTGYDMLMLDADTVFFQDPLSILDIHDKRYQSADVVFSTDAREFYQKHNAFRDEWRRGDIIPPVCNGIFWMQSSPKTIALWRQMLAILHGGWRTWWYRSMTQFSDDQRGMDVLLNDGRAQLVGPYPDGIDAKMVPKSRRPANETVNVRLLDQTLVVNGQLLRNRNGEYQQHLAHFRELGQERIAAHFNWDTAAATKVEGAQSHGLYFLDPEGKCKFDL